MTTYKGIKGFSVKFVSANPPVAQEGEVFYNSTSGKVASHISVAAVSSGTPMTTGRNAMGTTTSTGSSIQYVDHNKSELILYRQQDTVFARI